MRWVTWKIGAEILDKNLVIVNTSEWPDIAKGYECWRKILPLWGRLSKKAPISSRIGSTYKAVNIIIKNGLKQRQRVPISKYLHSTAYLRGRVWRDVMRRDCIWLQPWFYIAHERFFHQIWWIVVIICEMQRTYGWTVWVKPILSCTQVNPCSPKWRILGEPKKWNREICSFLLPFEPGSTSCHSTVWRHVWWSSSRCGEQSSCINAHNSHKKILYLNPDNAHQAFIFEQYCLCMLLPWSVLHINVYLWLFNIGRHF